MYDIISTSNSTEETLELGKRIAPHLKKGDVIVMTGDLGAGKTLFTSGILEYFGKKDEVSSPTFTIVNEYEGETKVNHFDLYRINSIDELENIGIYEYIYSESVCLFEWPERAEELLLSLENLVKINIRKVNDKTREIIVE